MSFSRIQIAYRSIQIIANTTKITHIKNYMLAALFNAPSTMSSYYQAEVNHNMYGKG
jgi:hypothetical protein